MSELAKLTLVQLAEKIAKNRMMFCTVAVTEAEKVYLNGQYVQIITEFDRRQLLHESTLALMRDVF